MSNTLIAIVTGANRGIGEAICKLLASTASGHFVLYATSRKGADLGIRASSKDTQVRYPQLDIGDPTSIKHLAESIQNDHDGLDVLINNAGVNYENDYTPANVKSTLAINYHANLQMCQTFIPLMKKTGRIVNMSSEFSSLKLYSNEIKQRFQDPELTLEGLGTLVSEYEGCVESGAEHRNGWPRNAYAVSKAAMNAFTAILARQNPGLLINACCPGWVSTDMGKSVGATPPKNPVDGATIPIRLGFLDIDGVTGKFWKNSSLSSKGEGNVVEW